MLHNPVNSNWQALVIRLESNPMKIFVLLFSMAALAHAEIFLGPSNSTNRLQIATNEMIVTSDVVGTLPDSPWPFTVFFVSNGLTNTLPTDSAGNLPGGSFHFSGPAELVLTNVRVGFSFRRISAPYVKSVMLAPQSSNTVTVPAGKSIRLLYGNKFVQFIAISRDGETGFVALDRAQKGGEYSGPLTIHLWNDRPYSVHVPYYFTEEAVVLPEQKLMMGPVGSYEILVEKSADLTNWIPVVVHTTSVEQKQFYRLRLTR